MNVNDVTEVPKPSGDIWALIFDYQESLKGKYRDIEIRNGFHYPAEHPLDLHSRRDQHLLKDFKWRVTEELAEAVEALHRGEDLHFLEELSDALHFMVELCLLAGVHPHSVAYGEMVDLTRFLIGEPYVYQTSVITQIHGSIIYLGLAANCLKNKPWKDHHMLTDEAKYRTLLVHSFRQLLSAFRTMGMSDENIFEIYFRKNQVNHFRIRSRY